MPVISPKVYIYAASLLALVLAWGGSMWWAYDHGKNVEHEAWQASITKDAVAQANLVHASDIVTNTVITHTVDRVQLVLTQGATITKEIPVYVTQKADAACSLTVGFARVFNASAGGKALDANATSGAYDAALNTPLSDITGVIGDNLKQCRVDQEHLRGLQAWVIGQQDLTNKGP